MIDPPLGEASGPQTYFKGQLPVAAPPAVLVGSADCVANGMPPGDFSPGPVPGGIDARCYPPGLAPDPSPVLWFLASAAGPHAAGTPIPVLPDQSVYRDDATNVGLLNTATYGLAGDTHLFIAFSAFKSMLLTALVPLLNDWAVIVTTYIVPASGTALCTYCPRQAGLAQGPIVLDTSNVSCIVGTTNLVVPWASSPLSSINVFAARCVSGVCHLRQNGVELGFGAINQTAAFGVRYPATSTRQFFPPFSFTATAGLQELMVFNQPLSLAGFLNAEAAVRARAGV